MRTMDIKNGTVVLAKHSDGEFKECLVSNNNQGLITIDGEEGAIIVAGGDLNLKWRIQYEKSFAGVGHIKKGSCIRLGRKLGKVFIPGMTTLFADGFKLDDGDYVVLGRNLNKNIYRELKVSDHKKTWILETN